MKNADAITEVDCNEGDGCECECYAQKPLKEEPEEATVAETYDDTSKPSALELILAVVGTALILTGFTFMSIPHIHLQ
jgi:hypothetical protein